MHAGEAFTLKRLGVPARIGAEPEYVNIEEIRTAIRRVMWEKVGIIRCDVSLREASAELERHCEILNKDFISRRGLELKNILTVASLITRAAVNRKGSVGAHYRSDFKDRGDDGVRHYQLRRDNPIIVTTID
jgi:L-aspartate oxidase